MILAFFSKSFCTVNIYFIHDILHSIFCTVPVGSPKAVVDAAEKEVGDGARISFEFIQLSNVTNKITGIAGTLEQLHQSSLRLYELLN